MAVRYSSARNRRTRHVSQSVLSPNALTNSAVYPTTIAEKAINWLSVVDNFKIQKHRNVFPRWSLVIIVLAVIAI